ncbi:MAG: hypothetical protein ACOYU4_00575 [Thermodesulfobacteriota bacterium]
MANAMPDGGEKEDKDAGLIFASNINLLWTIYELYEVIEYPPETVMETRFPSKN